MIIGNGLLASAFSPEFSDDPNVVVFASGVSNSREKDQAEFLRERQFLIDAMSLNKFVIYFSTCSVYDPDLAGTPYVRHKVEMEQLVRKSKEFAVFRLPQVVGHSRNMSTLTNWLYSQITTGTPFDVWTGATRNLIDVSDVASIASYLVKKQGLVGLTENIASPVSIAVMDLVRIFERILGTASNFRLIDGGGSYLIDASLSEKVAQALGIQFGGEYIEKLIRKYYAQ